MMGEQAQGSECVGIDSLPILSACTPPSLVRLIPSVKQVEFEKGEVLYQAGAEVDFTYFIKSGSVVLSSSDDTVLVLGPDTFFGEEGALGAEKYLATATVEEKTVVIFFPNSGLAELITANPHVSSRFYESLINHTPYEHPFNFKSSEKKSLDKQSLIPSIGWLATILLPIAAYLSCLHAELSWTVTNFFTIISAAVLMWGFKLLPEYVPAIFVILGVVILGLVPSDVVLAGYSSGSFFMALSVFAIGAVLVSSGFTYRIVLNMLRLLPKSGRLYDFAIFMAGLLLTPVLPSANARVQLTSPLLHDLAKSVGYRFGGPAATRMAASTFIGASLFSSAFLTSKSVNFVLFGTFPDQVREQFTWGFWVYASSIAIVILFFGHFFLSKIFFNVEEKANLSKTHIDEQIRVLGPMSSGEWIAFLGIVLFILGVVTSSVHKIQMPWVALSVFFIFMTLGCISKKELKQSIDWPFLMMLGGFVGLAQTMVYLRIDQMISTQLSWIGEFMYNDIYIFVLILAAVIYLIRLMIPNNAAVILIASVFLPIAIEQGINPWVVAFMILIFSDGWLLSFQSSYYLLFTELAKDSKLFHEKQMAKYNLLTNSLRFLAVFASIPFWRYLGLIN